MKFLNITDKKLFYVHLGILLLEIILPFFLYLALQNGNTLLTVGFSLLLAGGLLSLIFLY